MWLFTVLPQGCGWLGRRWKRCRVFVVRLWNIKNFLRLCTGKKENLLWAFPLKGNKDEGVLLVEGGSVRVYSVNNRTQYIKCVHVNACRIFIFCFYNFKQVFCCSKMKTYYKLCDSFQICLMKKKKKPGSCLLFLIHFVFFSSLGSIYRIIRL